MATAIILLTEIISHDNHHLEIMLQHEQSRVKGDNVLLVIGNFKLIRDNLSIELTFSVIT